MLAGRRPSQGPGGQGTVGRLTVREVSAIAHAHLAAWFSEKPTFAVMGEFSAGKSTLLNLILGERILPTKVTATNMPVTWMTYADSPRAQSLSHDGRLRDFPIADLVREGEQGHLLIRLSLPFETLRHGDVIDTPGISDRRLAAGALDFIRPYLDFVVWCSAANQAWRQTEKSMWQGMPQSLQDLSILCLTRADMLTKPADLDKVIQRCKVETDGLFRDVVPVATVTALHAMDAQGEVTDPAAWKTSRAEDLFDTIKASLGIARQNCAQRDVIAPPADPTPDMVDDVSVPDMTPAETAEPEVVAAAPDLDAVSPASTIAGAVVSVDNFLCKLRQTATVITSNDHIFDATRHFLAELRLDKTLSEAHRSVLERAMSLDGSGHVPPQLVLAQLVREVEDFAQDTWCRLDKVH